MKNYLSIPILLFLSMVMQTQDETTGTTAGKLSGNKNEMDSQSLPFVNIIIKETIKENTSGFVT